MKLYCGLRGLPALAALILMAAGIMSCREEVKVNVASKINASRMPTMSTRNIATLISDSGITQYKIVAPLWEVYDNIDHPYWRFPEGLFLRKFDRNLNVIATIAADSGVFFKDKNLWRLDGRVEVTKMPDELFQTNQVFWDQNKGIVYSDSFIHIENSTHMMEGYGFHAKQDFTGYSIHRPLGIFPVDRENIQGGGSPVMPGPPPAGQTKVSAEDARQAASQE